MYLHSVQATRHIYATVSAKNPMLTHTLPTLKSVYPAYKLKVAVLIPDMPVPPLKLNIVLVFLVYSRTPTVSIAD